MLSTCISKTKKTKAKKKLFTPLEYSINRDEKRKEQQHCKFIADSERRDARTKAIMRKMRRDFRICTTCCVPELFRRQSISLFTVKRAISLYPLQQSVLRVWNSVAMFCSSGRSSSTCNYVSVYLCIFCAQRTLCN